MAGQPTPLHDATASSGATFEDWEDWNLPLDYGDPAAEYTAVLESAALYDTSYTGRLKAVGADVLDLLHRLSTNDVESLAPGQGAPTILTTDRGRILDLITVANRGDHVLLLTSPSMQTEVIEWLDRYTFVEDVAIEDMTPSTAMISVIGPNAPALLGNIGKLDASALPPYGSTAATIGGTEVQLLRRDMLHLARFDLIMPKQDGAHVWRELVAAGATPLGTEAYQALRVSLGIPAHGSELGHSYNPLEAGLVGAISFTKGCYIGQEVVARLDTYQKVQRRMVSLALSSPIEAASGTKLNSDGREVGTLTSVARVPTTGKLVGLGYVRSGAVQPGARLDLSGTDGAYATIQCSVEPLGPSID